MCIAKCIAKSFQKKDFSLHVMERISYRMKSLSQTTTKRMNVKLLTYFEHYIYICTLQNIYSIISKFCVIYFRAGEVYEKKQL